MAKTSPTQRSLKWLRANGLTAQVVERFNSFSKTRIDLFSFIDIVAMGSSGIVGVQATSSSNLAARITKITEEPKARMWLESGGQIEAHGFAKQGAQGKRKVYVMRRVRVYLDCGSICSEEIT